MDLIKCPKNIQSLLKKYRAVLVVILSGFLLMNLPQKHQDAGTSPEEPVPRDFQQELQDVLCCIQGAGKVKLFLSAEAGEVTVYQNNVDQNGNQEDFRRETVILRGESRQEQGLVRQIIAPRYRGAVVIAQGADSPAVRLAIVKAVSSASGLGANNITVLKMK